MDEIESLNNFYSRVNFDAFSKSCQIAMFKHNIVKFLQNVWKISSVDYHCLCADDFLVRIDIFSSDFANNSDDYIFSIIQLTIFYWQIAHLSRQTAEPRRKKICARFFSSNHKEQPKIHMIVAIWRVFLSVTIFVFHTNPRVRTVLHCSGDEMYRNMTWLVSTGDGWDYMN